MLSVFPQIPHYLTSEKNHCSCSWQLRQNRNHIKVTKRYRELSGYQRELDQTLPVGSLTINPLQKKNIPDMLFKANVNVWAQLWEPLYLAGKHAYCLQSSRTSWLTCLTSPDTAAVPHIHKSTQTVVTVAVFSHKAARDDGLTEICNSAL